MSDEHAYRTLGAYLEQDGWYPQEIEDTRAYRVIFGGRHGRFVCYASIREDLQQLCLYVIAPTAAPAARRSAVAEYLTRANYGMRIGNFELDFDDGEVRYKSAIDYEGEELTANWIRNTLYPAVTTADLYLPGLEAVIHGGQTVLDAIRLVEAER